MTKVTSITLNDLELEEKQHLLSALLAANPWLVGERDLWLARYRTLTEKATKEFDRYSVALDKATAAILALQEATSSRAHLKISIECQKAATARDRHWQAYKRYDRLAEQAWRRAFPSQGSD